MIYKFIFFLVGSSIILVLGYNFPDYDSYSNYVYKENGYLRYVQEPISAVFVYFVSILKLDTIYLFYFTWVFYFFSCLKVADSLEDSFYKILFLFFLLFNPLSLILYQTPRFLLAISFFYIAFLHLNKSIKKSIFFLIFCFLSHNFLGLISLSFLFIRYSYSLKTYWFLFISFSFLFCFFILANIISQSYPYYFNHDVYDRGVGRYFYTLTSVLILCFLSLKRFKDFTFYLICLIMFSYLMYLTPYFHRVSSVLIFMIFYTICYYKSSLYYKYIISIFFIFSSIFSFFIVYFGLYSYGPSIT